MTDYYYSIIYTIKCIDDESLVYVGSTTRKMGERWLQHKKDSMDEKCKSYNSKFYKAMREKGIDNWKVELYERFPCESRAELSKREGEIIKEIGTLNTALPGCTPEEKRERQRQRVKEYNKLHSEENKVKSREYHAANKDIINEKRRMNRKPLTVEKQEARKAYCKEYHLKNAVEEREKYKKFYEENRYRINERRRERRRMKKEAMGAATNEKELEEKVSEMKI